MKKTVIILTAAIVALSSCRSLREEWEPVFTFDSNKPSSFVPYTEATLPGFSGTFTTIRDLKAMYKGALELTDNIWIKGQVISSDVTGNIYKELYIQDETGGIDLKLGKSSLYSEYQLGQWIYVCCKGLTLGAYNGMPQLGMAPDNTSTNEYETSYIDSQAIINDRVFRGAFAAPLAPVEVSEDMLKEALSAGYTGELWGKYVSIKGMTYGDEVFVLLYPNPNLPHKSGNPENRVFISDGGNWGVTTWAMSKSKYLEYIQEGNFDTAQVGSGSTRYGTILGRPVDYLEEGSVLASFGKDAELSYKDIMIKYAGANTLSQYFYLGNTAVQIRTSGYAKFCDEELDEKLLLGVGACDVTGILSIYSGSAQLTLLEEPSKSVKVYWKK